MQFLVVGLDGKDKKARERRAVSRGDHIKLGDELVVSGNVWYGAALLDDEGNMNGSAFFVDFPSEKELNEWLKKEPYVVAKVWKKINIYRCSTRDPWQFNRSKEFYLEKQKQ